MRDGLMATEILSSDDCEDLSPARRQRINRLANGFLAGKPLFIASAQATGSDLRESLRTILKERRIPTPEPDLDQDDAIWADEPSPRAALRQRRHLRPAPPKVVSRQTTERPATQRVRPPRLSTKPSEEALAKAAQLRARKASEQPVREKPLAASVTHSAPPTARKVISFDQRAESRRVCPRTPADDTLADELRLSRTESPSRRPKATGLPLLGNVSFSSNGTVENPPGRAYRQHQVPTGMDEPSESFVRDFSETDSSALSCQTEATGKNDVTRSLGSAGPTSTGDLGSTAMELCTAEQNRPDKHLPRATWTPINAHAALQTLKRSTSQSPATNATNADLTTAYTPSLSSAKSSTGKRTQKATKGKQRASKGSQGSQGAKVSQSSSHNGTSQQGLKNALQVKKPAFVTAPASQSGSTPFVYRKRSKASAGKDTETSEDEEPQRKRSDLDRRSIFSGQGVSVTPESHTIGRESAASTAAPVTNVSSDHHTEFVRDSELALMDQHMNKKLPTGQDSARRSSSVRRALRCEMRMSGAEISRVPGDPSSSQPDPSADHTTNDHHTADTPSDIVSDKRRRATMQWPGTQMLLNQAQHDLFMSPEKTSGSMHNPNETGSCPEHTDSVPETGRPPLGQLSQECLPGTQALMEGWSPWSTVKKPKTAKRASFAPSPLAPHNKATPSDEKTHSLRNSVSACDAVLKTTNRRSSLRFSMSTAETPVPPQRKHSALRPSMTDSQLLADNTIRPVSSAPSTGLSAQCTAGEVDITSFSFAEINERMEQEEGSTTDIKSGQQCSSFQAAQVIREDSNPERTLADLATEFLSTTDMHAILR